MPLLPRHYDDATRDVDAAIYLFSLRCRRFSRADAAVELLLDFRCRRFAYAAMPYVFAMFIAPYYMPFAYFDTSVDEHHSRRLRADTPATSRRRATDYCRLRRCYDFALRYVILTCYVRVACYATDAAATPLCLRFRYARHYMSSAARCRHAPLDAYGAGCCASDA